MTVQFAGAQSGSGSIIGTVTDNSGAMLPGASITVSGPATMGVHTIVTGAKGEYRISALDPGTYQLVFAGPGFGTVTREGITLAVGFTATINVTLSPASVSENVTVTSASPVVDLASSRVTTDLAGEELDKLTAKADYSSVLDLTPGVAMSKPDVGGSGAIAYANGPRYGIQGEDRGEVEGISTTEQSSGGAELPYTDEHTFEDMAMTVIGNTAEMPQPGTLTQVVVRSGGNQYHGHVSGIYENSALESHNIDARQLARGVVGGPGLAAVDSNRLQSFSDLSAYIGGFIKRDKLWWFGGFRREALSQGITNLVGAPQVSTMPVYTGKMTYNISRNNKLIGFFQEGIKHQNPGVPPAQVFPLSAGQTENWPSGLWKGEWDTIINSSMVIQVRGGDFFERGHFIANDQTNLQYMDTGANTLTGSFGNREYLHDRWQLNGNMTYFKNGWFGTHNFKVGGEGIHETASNTVTHLGNIEMILNNGQPSQVTLFQPSTANLTGLREFGAYAEDSWQIKSRLTLNYGIRFDQYTAYTPAQTGPGGQQFAKVSAPVWNNFAPRLGGVYALTKDGKTLVKASYGFFWEDPFVYSTIQNQFNPNAPSSSTYVWTPTNPTIVNGLPVFQPGQQGVLLSTTGNVNGKPAVTIDPNLSNGYMDQATAYFEREVAPNFGVRTGFVWNGWRHAYGTVNTSQPYSAFTAPTTVVVPGPDNKVADTTGTVTAYDIPGTVPGVNQVLQDLPSFIGNSDYYTWEITATKRRTGRWSLMTSFFRTWSHESPFATGFGVEPPYFTPTVFNPNTAINTTGGQNVYTSWGFKAMGSYDIWHGIRLSPLLRSQSGLPFARTFNATNLKYNSAVVIKAEPFGAEHLPTINIFDLRTEKEFKVKERLHFVVSFDLYNLFNSNATQAATFSSGASFLRPTTITGPRMAGFGGRFDF